MKKKRIKQTSFISRVTENLLLFVKVNKQHLRCKLSYEITQFLPYIIKNIIKKIQF